MSSIGLPELVIVLTVVGVWALIVVWPAARICERLGYPRWLGVLAVVPVANLLLLWYLALAPWPRPLRDHIAG